MHSFSGFRKQSDVGIATGSRDVVLPAATPLHAGLVAAVGPRRQIRLDSNDGVDACSRRLAPKLIRAKHHAVVGDGYAWHF